jgi:hypothetical protein
MKLNFIYIDENLYQKRYQQNIQHVVLYIDMQKARNLNLKIVCFPEVYF